MTLNYKQMFPLDKNQFPFFGLHFGEVVLILGMCQRSDLRGMCLTRQQ